LRVRQVSRHYTGDAAAPRGFPLLTVPNEE
jgi:hypothetical protein